MEAKNFDPVGNLGNLESLTDSVRDALAAASAAGLDDAAARMATTPELAGADPADFVHRLAELARRADGWHLYCYWAL